MTAACLRQQHLGPHRESCRDFNVAPRRESVVLYSSIHSSSSVHVAFGDVGQQQLHHEHIRYDIRYDVRASAAAAQHHASVKSQKVSVVYDDLVLRIQWHTELEQGLLSNPANEHNKHAHGSTTVHE